MPAVLGSLQLTADSPLIDMRQMAPGKEAFVLIGNSSTVNAGPVDLHQQIGKKVTVMNLQLLSLLKGLCVIRTAWGTTSKCWMGSLSPTASSYHAGKMRSSLLKLFNSAVDWDSRNNLRGAQKPHETRIL